MRRLGSSGNAPLLAVVTIVALLAFFAWLYLQARNAPEEVPIVEVEEEASEALALSDLGGDPAALVGNFADIQEAAVRRNLGRGAFLLGVGETATYPVLLSPDLIQQSMLPDSGDLVAVKGRIYTLNDSIRSAWLEQGAVETLAGISAAVSFLLADSLHIN